MKAVKGEEIFLSTENKIGKLDEVCCLIKEAGVNIRALSAYVSQDKAFFRIVTSDNLKTKQSLAKLGTLESKEIVIVELADSPGALAAIATLFKKADIDIYYIYGTANPAERTSLIVFSSNNNDLALQALTEN
jgi:hypothetical protein